MPVLLFSIFHLLVAVLFLQLGSGLQGLLIPIRGQLEGFSVTAIGLLGTAYYLGFILGCLSIPYLMNQVGHIRTFSGFASLAVAAFLMHEILVTFSLWLGLRLIIGFCFAGLYMAVESWLNARATIKTRGRIMAVYMVTTWIAVIGAN